MSHVVNKKQGHLRDHTRVQENPLHIPDVIGSSQFMNGFDVMLFHEAYPVLDGTSIVRGIRIGGRPKYHRSLAVAIPFTELEQFLHVLDEVDRSVVGSPPWSLAGDGIDFGENPVVNLSQKVGAV